MFRLDGSTIFVKVSAKTGDGIDELLEMIHLQAEILELKSTSKGSARGTIIESRVKKGQGPVGTVLVQRGTLKIGDYFVMGNIHGRIRAMFNEVGEKMIEAGPAIPVEISGLSNVPEVGVNFVVLEDEKIARQIAEDLELKLRSETIREYQNTSLDNLFSKIEENKIDEQIAKLESATQAISKFPPMKNEVTFDDFSKMDIRVGEIITAEKVEKADKLLKLTVNTGLDTRIIVSGIAEHYSPKDVVGQKVSILMNLAPRKIRGVESQGMILMAEDDEGKLSFVAPAKDMEAGGEVR